MDQVPKVLRPLVQEWTPEGYIVSFKVRSYTRLTLGIADKAQLETEQELLIPKSRAALSRYGHQLVIGNELHNRKHEVVFVERRLPAGLTSLAELAPPQKGQGDSRLKGAETPPLTEKGMDGDQIFKPVEEYTEKWIRLADLPDDGRTGEVEIEEIIIRELLERHERWMAGANTDSTTERREVKS